MPFDQLTRPENVSLGQPISIFVEISAISAYTRVSFILSEEHLSETINTGTSGVRAGVIAEITFESTRKARRKLEQVARWRRKLEFAKDTRNSGKTLENGVGHFSVPVKWNTETSFSA